MSAIELPGSEDVLHPTFDIDCPITRLNNLYSLGYGYCPVTEDVKPVSLLEGVGMDDMKVVEFDSNKYLIPECINAYKSSTASSRKYSFRNTEEYQRHMQSSYGIDSGFKLIIKANAGCGWMSKTKGSSSYSLVSMIHEKQVAIFRLINPREKVKYREFLEALKVLTGEYTGATAEIFRSFFSYWGSHLIYQQAVGGEIQLNYTMNRASQSMDKLRKMEAKIYGKFKGDIGTVSGSAHGRNSTLTHLMSEVGVSDEDLHVSGGNTDLLSLDTFTPSQFKEWMETVGGKPDELKRSIKLFPYFNFLDPGKHYEALRQATSDHMGDILESKIKRYNERQEGIRQAKWWIKLIIDHQIFVFLSGPWWVWSWGT